LSIIKQEFLFFIFLFLLVGFTIQNPSEIYNFNSYISWGTIRALSVLLLLTTAMRLSNVFNSLAEKFIVYFKTEKYLALFFVFSTVFLSMFLTNDITIFIIVPITISISKYIKNDLTTLVIFEAISANVGSLLTPIGNPQNLFIFREWNISFIEFIDIMSPIFIINFILLFLFTLYIFPSKRLEIGELEQPKKELLLFFSGLIFFIVFIISLELNFVRYIIPIIIVWFLVIKREVFFKFDYFLIFTFILMFIDFNIISDIEVVKTLISSVELTSLNVFNLSVLFSQAMSNIPALIFMSKFSSDYQAIVYGTNVAGNGLIIASLANIIAIRMLNSKQAYINYHKYAIPYFFISYISVLLLIY